jgi:isoquinoline 1-oxidoreductase alpha subunit
MTVNFTLNGKPVSSDDEDDTPLLWVLRDTLGLMGTKYGCGIAQCGACTVHVDGRTRRSCITPLHRVDRKRVVTIEGADSAIAQAVQQAWTDLDVPQCGFCQSGQIMSVVALLGEVVQPSDSQIDAALAGNICRCATYQRIREATKRAARKMRDSG